MPHRVPLLAFIQRLSLDFESVSARSYVGFAMLSCPVFIDSSIRTVRIPACVAWRVNEGVVASQVSHHWLGTLNQYRVNHGNTPSILIFFP